MSQAPEQAADGRSTLDDPSIPVLTDRIYLPALDLDIPVPGRQRSAAGSSSDSLAPAAQATRGPRADVQILGGTGGASITAAIEAAIADAVKKAAARGGTGSTGWKVPASYAATHPHDDRPLTEEDLGRDIESEYAADVETLLEADRDLTLTSTPAETASASAAEEEAEQPPATETQPAADAGQPPTESTAAVEAPAAGGTEWTAAVDAEVIEPPSAETPAAELAEAVESVAAEVIEPASVEPPAPPAAGELPADVAPAPVAAPLPPEARVTLLLQPVASVAAEPLPAIAAAESDQAPDAAIAAAQAERTEVAAAPPATGIAHVMPPDMQADALREALLHSVAQRLPERVNAAMRDLMQPAIDEAISRIGEDAQVALRITMQDLVEQVLREELARYRVDPNSG